ncbi:Cell division protein FtsI [Candidatus Rhodobacter oscarellae]|uniref:Cell division protein FtsI n=1 Tax=Candidatus Rhodobacter oscarellae TaxID=1675527 RepID=A0A0J9E9W0_9RHOB|nr:M56 family metallopeptidase [Candidatus Rhodobacter lobularis]KMW59421.1 Cell division protein FtsI [Candidatus Rhodobacter lobularis]
MIPVEAVLDAYINANILIVVAFALWSAVAFALRRVGLEHSYGTQLQLLNTVFLAILLSPFLVMLFFAAQSAGVAKGVNVNLSDMVVSHFLNGGFEMNATQFERLLQIRETLITNIANAAGISAWIAISAFLAGLLIGVGRLIYSMYCLQVIVSQSYHLRRFGRLRIRVSDRTLVPFSTRGLWYYHVVIPAQMMGEQGDVLRVSLAHEFQHLRQGDIEWEIILEALKPFFFLNPAFHAWKRRVEGLRELSCDHQVMSRGRIGRRTYCDTLLSVCQQTLRRDRNFVIAVPKVTLVTADRTAIGRGKQSLLEQRINSILDARMLRNPKLVYAGIMIPMTAAVLLTAVAIQRPADWSQDRLTLSTVVNLERLDEINRLSTFGRIRN